MFRSFYKDEKWILIPVFFYRVVESLSSDTKIREIDLNVFNQWILLFIIGSWNRKTQYKSFQFWNFGSKYSLLWYKSCTISHFTLFYKLTLSKSGHSFSKSSSVVPNRFIGKTCNFFINFIFLYYLQEQLKLEFQKKVFFLLDKTRIHVSLNI